MAVLLKTSTPDFAHTFADLMSAKREDSPDVAEVVDRIIQEVRVRGDEALRAYTARFDLVETDELRFTQDEIESYADMVGAEERAALELAAERIETYHRHQLPENKSWTDEHGAVLGWRWTAVSAAGLYVPGGLASYPSSVLMNAIPARVAGVERLAITVPTPENVVNPLVMLAAKICGVTEVYRVGGAQAIAALAYGTKTIKPVDKITGPGNAFVAAAKRQVFGQVGIDMIAGPSEVLILADNTLDPAWAALDLMAQAEHDASAQSVLITTDLEYARAVMAAVDALLPKLERSDIAGASWRDFGAVVVARDWDEAVDLCNKMAPEHLEIACVGQEAIVEKVRHAGAIFLGPLTPEAIGDYVGGPNHVLPTARSARFSSGLSVLDFMKRTTISQMTPGTLERIGPAASCLANVESLQAHGDSVRVRLAQLNHKDDAHD